VTAKRKPPAKPARGRPPVADPKHGTTSVRVDMAPDLLADVEAAAVKDGRSRTNWIVRAIRAALRGGK
jgi:hypothetical protein